MKRRSRQYGRVTIGVSADGTWAEILAELVVDAARRQVRKKS